MNLDILFALIFYGLIFIFFINNRERFEIQGKIFALYRTKYGLKLMDKIAKSFPRILHFVSYISIMIAFLGMVVMFGFLIYGISNMVFKPAAPPVLAPVLPGIQIAGAPPLSFWHWIIAIFFAAAIHEFSHGVFARLYKIKVKSSGFAFLGPILAAFVEPDEKSLSKTKTHHKLAIFSAGPFSNILVGALLILLVSLAMPPIINSVVEFEGVQIVDITSDSPIDLSGMSKNELILTINDVDLESISTFQEVLKDIKPRQDFSIVTNTSTYFVAAVPHPEDYQKGYLGLSVNSHFRVKSKLLNFYPGDPLAMILWFLILINWLITINIGIGLFNLLPLGPVDGGRMFYATSLFLFKKEEKAKRVWSSVSFFCLFLIFINLLPWILKLVLFVSTGIVTLVSFFV